MLSLSSDCPFDSFFTFLTPSPMAVEVVTTSSISTSSSSTDNSR